MGLLKVGREKRYKIGKTNLVERRRDQISIQLPEDLELLHAIKTDDATGIEAYWHKRFEAKKPRGNGSLYRAKMCKHSSGENFLCESILCGHDSSSFCRAEIRCKSPHVSSWHFSDMAGLMMMSACGGEANLPIARSHV
jgi:hypothetical protein